MREFIVLLKHNLVLEGRSKEGLVLLFFLGLTLSLVVSLGLGSALLDPYTRQRIFPALYWAIFVFTATSCLSRSFDADFENRAIDALRLNVKSLSKLYLAKTFSNVIWLFIGTLWILACLYVFLNLEVFSPWLLLISLLVILAYTPLATLLAALSMGFRLRQVLYPVLVLPLLFPLFFTAVELSAQTLFEKGLNLESPWLYLLLAMDVLYFILGAVLFEFTLGHE